MTELLRRDPQSPCSLRARENLPFFRNKNSAARAAFEDAVADQFLVGAGDSVGIDHEHLGEGADGRELLAHLQLAQGNGAMDLMNDLTKDRDIAGRRDGKREGHVCTSTLVH